MTVEKALRVLRANPRNPEAWEIIANNVYEPLLTYVASLLLTFRIQPGETARDIVHDVLLRFYERWPTNRAAITSEGELQAYLRSSCRNLLVDRYRRERNAQQLIAFLELKFRVVFENESDLYKSIFLNEIIRMLPEECASLFNDYITKDLSPAEIADITGASPATFYSRWYRCIEKAKLIFMQKKELLKRL